MAKIMLVEDDINLSEIYKARLEAEGYTIISAADGEAALALAVKEHPDLIICDVMMPKISGFEMLDILRGTVGIQNTKVIMMTALSQAEDKERASSLGADRYLVKSQVTLEDVVQTAKDILAENGVVQPQTPPIPANVPTAVSSNSQPPTAPPASNASNSAQSQTDSPAVPANSQVPTTPITVSPAPPQVPTAKSTDTETENNKVVTVNNLYIAPSTAKLDEADRKLSQTSANEEKTINQQIEDFIGQNPVNQAKDDNTTQTQPVSPPNSTPVPQSGDGINIPGKKVIQPINDPNAKPDLEMLLAKEQAKELEKASAQPLVNDGSKTPTETSGYLNTPVIQPGQSNPNNDQASVDPNSIAL